MRKAVLAIALLLVIAAPCYAQYNIYLKNGAVLKGVSQYKEVDGEVRFQYMGGTVGIPIDNVLRVEKAGGGGEAASPGEGGPGMIEHGTPVVPPYQQAGVPAPQDTGPIKTRIAQINSRLAEIAVSEQGRDKVKEEYDRVRLRIEVLFQKGIAEAKRQGGDPAKWFQFLPAQEREWAQLNTLKKNKLKKDLEEMDLKLAPVLAEKEALLKERGELEQQLREMENPY